MNQLDLSIPRSWSDLSDRQLHFVYRLIALDVDGTTLKLRCLMRWNGLHLLRTVGKLSRFRTSGARHAARPRTALLSSLQLAEVLEYLTWMDSLPRRPVRLSRVGKVQARSADLAEVPFEQFLILENLYQGYLHTKDKALLGQMAAVLYPGLLTSSAAMRRVMPAVEVCVFYWYAALKQYLADLFPHFFRPIKDSSSLGQAPVGQRLREAMNAQIRALTKGDVTKEQQVLSLDTLRALTELDAQAREYEELKRKS